MTFEKWWEANINTESPLSRYDKANAAWDFQQRYIDVLEREVSLQATQLEYIDTALRTWRSDSEYSVSYTGYEE